MISGVAEDEGKPVTFTVDGKDSGTSYDWESGKQVLAIELSVGDVADSGSSKKSSTSGEDSGVEVIESSVPQQNVTVQEKTVPENTGVDSGDDAGVEQTAESSEDSSETSSEPESAPGFPIIYAVAGIVLLTFGSNLGRESRRKP